MVRIFLALVCLVLWLPGPVGAEPPLRLAFLPYLAKEAILSHYGPLADYLGRALGREVVIEIAPSYDAHIWAVERDDPDIAFLGGASYVTVTRHAGPKPLLARFEIDGAPTFHSVVFALDASPLTDLADLKGRTLALGPHESTLSHIVPRYMLAETGIMPGDLKDIRTLGSHDDIIYGVLLGTADAGAVAQEVFEEHRDKGLRALGVSAPISTHVFVANPALPADLRRRITDLLVGLKDDPDGAAALAALGPAITGFARATPGDYDNLRRIMNAATP